MKASLLLSLLLLGLQVSCNPSGGASKPAAVQDDSSAQGKPNVAGKSNAQEELRSTSQSLSINRTAAGEVSAESFGKLREVVLELQDPADVIAILNTLPNNQLAEFRTSLLELIKKVAPESGAPLNAHYLDALRLGRRIGSSDLADTVFPHLTRVPEYVFPEKPLPAGWGDPELSEHEERGVQGLLASTIVEFGDARLMTKYRELLTRSAPQLQRLMIWAMGRSPDIADFEFLWALRSQIADLGVQGTLTKALNAIPVSMNRVAQYPGGQANREGLDRANMERQAAALQKRLEDAHLVVELTIWD